MALSHGDIEWKPAANGLVTPAILGSVQILVCWSRRSSYGGMVIGGVWRSGVI